MPGKPTAIPVGSQFSPDLINLGEFLKAISKHSGDKDSMMKAIWRKKVRIKPPKNPPTPRRRSLPLEAAIQYGLLDKDYKTTSLTAQLQTSKGADLYREFARHILVELGGVRVVEAAQQMKQDSLNVTGDALAQYLTDQGFPVTVHNTAINSLRMWLAEAGIFSGGRWNVDASRKEEVLGLNDDQIAAIVGLTDEQRAFLAALCRVAPKDKYPAANVRDMAEQAIGYSFARASLPKAVLDPLREAGFIDYETKGTGGGKTSVLWTTAQFEKDVLEPFVSHAVESLDTVLTAYYERPPAEIYQDLGSTDTTIKGRALEAYAVHIMRLLGLRFVEWRKRAKETTGGAEVDVIMAGRFGPVPTRWQIQCKNTPAGTVRLDQVAKEVGLLPITKATHVMVLANCNFTRDAVTYANEVMRNSPVVIFLLNRADFERVRQRPSDLAAILRSKSDEISRLAGQSAKRN